MDAAERCIDKAFVRSKALPVSREWLRFCDASNAQTFLRQTSATANLVTAMAGDWLLIGRRRAQVHPLPLDSSCKSL